MAGEDKLVYWSGTCLVLEVIGERWAIVGGQVNFPSVRQQ